MSRRFVALGNRSVEEGSARFCAERSRMIAILTRLRPQRHQPQILRYAQDDAVCLKSSGASHGRRHGRAAGESGFVLLSVLVLVALMLLALAVAAPKVTEDIRRDKENEFYHRGLQYQRAVRLYYRRFQRYPTSLDQLENTNEIRFLRKRYKDPISGKDDWRLIHFGEAKVPQVGFFGQPRGIGTPAAALGTPTAGLSTFPSQGIGPSQTAGTTGTASTGDPASATPVSLSSGSTISVGPIVGVSSTSAKESIRTYRKQAHYNQWEFVYDPIQEQAMATTLGPSTGAGATPGAAGAASTPGGYSGPVTPGTLNPPPQTPAPPVQ